MVTISFFFDSVRKCVVILFFVVVVFFFFFFWEKKKKKKNRIHTQTLKQSFPRTLRTYLHRNPTKQTENMIIFCFSFFFFIPPSDDDKRILASQTRRKKNNNKYKKENNPPPPSQTKGCGGEATRSLWEIEQAHYCRRRKRKRKKKVLENVRQRN